MRQNQTRSISYSAVVSSRRRWSTCVSGGANLIQLKISFIEAGRQRTERERRIARTTERRKLRNTRIVAIAMTALAIAAGVLGVISYKNWRGSRERLASSRLLEAQAALRRHDIASAIVSFGAALDNLSASDPRASSAFAGIVANLASAPRVVNSFGEVWAAALSVDGDKVLVRRSTGQRRGLRSKHRTKASGTGCWLTPERFSVDELYGPISGAVERRRINRVSRLSGRGLLARHRADTTMGCSMLRFGTLEAPKFIWKTKARISS